MQVELEVLIMNLRCAAKSDDSTKKLSEGILQQLQNSDGFYRIIEDCSQEIVELCKDGDPFKLTFSFPAVLARLISFGAVLGIKMKEEGLI